MELWVAIFLLVSVILGPGHGHVEHHHYEYGKNEPCVYHDGYINIKTETTWGETIYTRFSFVGLTHEEVRARIVDEYYNKWVAKLGPYGGDLFKRKALEWGIRIHYGGDPTWDVRPIKWVEVVPYECY